MVLLLIALPLAAETRTYAGGFSTRWSTVGKHGHDQPLCAEPKITYFPPGCSMEAGTCHAVLWEGVNCNSDDFHRANLDNSIGFRLGRERDFASTRFLELVGGVEGSVSFTEYNMSQVDLSLISGAVNAGADLTVFGGRAGVRYGAGPFMTLDGIGGLQHYREFLIAVPLSGGAEFRLSQRRVNYSHRVTTYEMVPIGDKGSGVRGIETSVLLAGGAGDRNSKWEFTTATGMSEPGGGVQGAGLNLQGAPYHRLAIFRDTKWGVQGYTTWTATAHESKLEGTYKGYSGNYRSKTIDAFGVGVRRKQTFNEFLTFLYGGGIEVADWRDDYGLLVRTNGVHVIGGIEGAVALNGAVRFDIGRGTALEVHAEQVYWTGIRLSEMRWGVGLVLGR
jgi:hypothetical protein